jgi:hypothetical protein
MQFCPNCNNTYTIVKLSGAQHKSLIDTVNIVSETSSDSESEEKIKAGSEKISDNNTFEYYFRCTNCGYIESIEHDTMIISKNVSGTVTEYDNKDHYVEMVNHHTLPHTRNYICPNISCDSHTDHSLRDAIWFKPNKNNYKIKTICTTCKTMW